MPKVASLFTSMPTFLNVYFFLGDELHLLGHEMGHLVYNLLNPKTLDKYYAANPTGYSFDADMSIGQRNLMIKVGDCINASKSSCPAAFNYSFDKRTGYYRAVDWQDYLLYVVPTMVIPYLKHRSAKKALMSLVNAVAISLQREISSQDLDDMDR